eukprot:g6662.t1
MSFPPAEPAGLPALAVGMVVACVVMVVTTNRRFGHQTFHNTKRIGGGTARAGTAVVRRGSASSSTGSNDSSTNSSRVFEVLPEFGVLEVVASFLSPADLVGIATVSTDFCRASASDFLWRCHCERAFGASKPQLPLLGEDRRRTEQERHEDHFQHQEEQEERDRRRRGRLHEKQQGGNTAPGRRCRCGESSASGGQHRWRPAEDGGGHSGEHASLASHYCRYCSDSACCNYSWRAAFFRAHRAKPRDLLRGLSRSTSTQQPQAPRPCAIILHGRVHDLTEFATSHPGGSLILQEHAFTDATAEFERFFHSREARRMARQFVVWDGQAAMGRRGTLWKRSPVLRLMAFLAILYVTAAAAHQQQQRQRHQVLENMDLTDLLDAELEDPFQQQQQPRRHLQEEEMTQAPTSAPTGAPGEDGERGFVSFAPTPAATSMRDLMTEAPVTSGASSWRSSVGVASALAFVGSVAAAAVVA